MRKIKIRALLIAPVLLAIFTSIYLTNYSVVNADGVQPVKAADHTETAQPPSRTLEYTVIPMEQITGELGNPEYTTVSAASDEEAAEQSKLDQPKLELLDTFIATAYCTSGTTATGTTTHQYKPGEPGTLAVNPADIPLGSHVWLFLDDGTCIGDYYAEDTGGNLLRQNFVIDIFMSDYEDCIVWGAQHVSVYTEGIDDAEMPM